MRIEIKHRYTDAILFAGEYETLIDALQAAVKAKTNLGDADLTGAYLGGADLGGADLGGAYLGGAYLRGAYLRGAYLGGADLGGADLGGAYLGDADLTGAYLGDADLTGAYLGGADLRGAYLGGADLGSMEWEQYINEVVPALLMAGGKPLTEVATDEHWLCHDWSNCPMHAAFGANNLSEVPPLYRSAAETFCQFFDAGLIPKPQTSPAAVVDLDGVKEKP